MLGTASVEQIEKTLSTFIRDEYIICNYNPRGFALKADLLPGVEYEHTNVYLREIPAVRIGQDIDPYEPKHIVWFTEYDGNGTIQEAFDMYDKITNLDFDFTKPFTQILDIAEGAGLIAGEYANRINNDVRTWGLNKSLQSINYKAANVYEYKKRVRDFLQNVESLNALITDEMICDWYSQIMLTLLKDLCKFRNWDKIGMHVHNEHIVNLLKSLENA